MLFLFEQSGRHSFWMKNTTIPLDILWLDQSGRIVSIAHSVPPCKVDPCPSYPFATDARAVVEVLSGFVNQHGVKVADVVKIDGAIDFTFRSISTATSQPILLDGRFCGTHNDRLWRGAHRARHRRLSRSCRGQRYGADSRRLWRSAGDPGLARSESAISKARHARGGGDRAHGISGIGPRPDRDLGFVLRSRRAALPLLRNRRWRC